MRRSKTFRLLTHGLGVLALSVCLSTGSVLAADDTSGTGTPSGTETSPGTGTSSHSGSTKSMQTASAHKGRHRQHHRAHRRHHHKQVTPTTNPA
jgi:hypothetical protein